MTILTTKAFLPCVLALGFSLPACGEDKATDSTSTLTIKNDSSFAFLEIYLSPVGQANWGQDLLNSADVLLHGEVLKIGEIECDDYDIRIVDEDFDECIIDQVDLCLNDTVFVFDDLLLSACQEF